MSSEAPWKNGLWLKKSVGLHEVYEVEGKEVVKKSSAFFDIPDLPNEHVQKGTWSFGDFGAVPDPLKESTGVSTYNFESSYYKGALKIKGIFKDDKIFYQGKKEEIEELEEVLEQTELPPEWKELLRMRLMRVRMAIDMSRPKEDYFDFSPPGSAQFRLKK